MCFCVAAVVNGIEQISSIKSINTRFTSNVRLLLCVIGCWFAQHCVDKHPLHVLALPAIADHNTRILALLNDKASCSGPHSQVLDGEKICQGAVCTHIPVQHALMHIHNGGIYKQQWVPLYVTISAHIQAYQHSPRCAAGAKRS